MRCYPGWPLAALLLTSCSSIPDEDGDGYDIESDCDDAEEHPGAIWYTDTDST